ncbi:hypothetical protein [Chryseobacterium sp. A321]
MDDFKKDLFKKEYKKDFPCYFELEKEDCIEFKKRVIDKFRLKKDNFENSLRDNHFFLDDANAEDDNFDFLSLLNNLNIKKEEYLFINWNSFENIDKFSLNDFYNYFEDIWFPASDDIDIFNENLDWIISIRHDGVIYYTQL